MPVETTRVYMRRLAAKQRHIAVKRVQDGVHKKKKKHHFHKLTPEERKERSRKQNEKQNLTDRLLAEARHAIWELAEGLANKLGKMTAHWHQCLMQMARIAKAERKTSRWNAFVSLMLEQINNSEY